MGEGDSKEARGARESPPRPRDSLIVRIGLVLVLFIGLMTAALFLSIEYFVTQQFRVLHAANTERRAGEIRLYLESEGTHMQRLVELAATDSDLIHSAHYHLNLKGQNLALRQDVERVARSFALSRVHVWGPSGEYVMGNSGDDAQSPLAEPVRAAVDAGRAAVTGWTWQDDGLWIVATGRLRTTPVSHAYLSIARPLTPRLGTAYPFGREVSLRGAEAASAIPEGATRLELAGPHDEKTFIDVSFSDSVAEAVGATQRLLVIALSIGGLLLLAATTTYLDRTLRPIRSLTGLAAEVGKGNFRTQEQPKGDDEVARMVRAFNRMVGDILRFRTLEQKMYHEQRLAAVGKLAAKVAHDINNPLTVINNVASLLARQPSTGEETRRDLQSIVENTRRCAHIVENLLRFGRPLRLRFESIDLAQCCRQAAGQASIRLPEARLRIEGPRQGIRVQADRHELERVVDNLVNNAWQACPGEEIVVECGMAREGAYLAVIDGGKGFSGEALDHLFEPFFTTKPDGNGLGLASCLAIARAHGGDLRIADAGKGHVTLWLPTEEVAEPG
jgi:signal transduction histidine kinase